MSLTNHYINELSKKDRVLKENTVPFQHEASYDNIGGSLYSFLLSLKAKHPESKDIIDHWLIRIDEELKEFENFAMDEIQNGEDLTILSNLRGLLKSD